MMENVLKGSIGAGTVLLMNIIAKSRFTFLTGLVPLFPTFAVIGHYIVINSTSSLSELRGVVKFGMFSLIPYLAYLSAVYIISYKTNNTYLILGSGLVTWLLSACLLVLLYK